MQCLQISAKTVQLDQKFLAENRPFRSSLDSIAQLVLFLVLSLVTEILLASFAALAGLTQPFRKNSSGAFFPSSNFNPLSIYNIHHPSSSFPLHSNVLVCGLM